MLLQKQIRSLGHHEDEQVSLGVTFVHLIYLKKRGKGPTCLCQKGSWDSLLLVKCRVDSQLPLPPQSHQPPVGRQNSINISSSSISQCCLCEHLIHFLFLKLQVQLPTKWESPHSPVLVMLTVAGSAEITTFCLTCITGIPEPNSMLWFQSAGLIMAGNRGMWWSISHMCLPIITSITNTSIKVVNT